MSDGGALEAAGPFFFSLEMLGDEALTDIKGGDKGDWIELEGDDDDEDEETGPMTPAEA